MDKGSFSLYVSLLESKVSEYDSDNNIYEKVFHSISGKLAKMICLTRLTILL